MTNKDVIRGLGWFVLPISVYYIWMNFIGLAMLELIFGPQLNSYHYEGDTRLNRTRILIEGNGYPFESHEVTSASGYILSLHRIPSGIKKGQATSSKRPVVLIQHGLVAASDALVFRGPEVDLPYILADAGYDVWLSNMRGNVYSRKHQTLNPDRDSEYWEFSMHEIAVEDFPAMIDYILNSTKQEELNFLGYSIGSTTGLMFSSMLPEYNKKIKVHVAVAPFVYVNRTIPLSHKLLLVPGVPLSQTAIANGIYNFLPRRPYMSKLLQMLCHDRTPIQAICKSCITFLVGEDNNQFNSTVFPHFLEFFPAGTSIYLVQHTFQLYLSGNFAPFDYGNETINQRKYKIANPPPYNISQVTHPVSLHYGSGDIMVAEEDVDILNKKLPNSLGMFKVPYDSFNHMDFMWGTNTKKLVYDRLISIMDKYN
ncbi:unnamed protein product [Phaedon cochleariae]|uniref:Lipase n=1 Tax=Phaedon cochleariae TaxID=80249 RepID=A0A9P0DS83_PHACE|nr:unnamed protein product [Phaedon cochleariae]